MEIAYMRSIVMFDNKILQNCVKCHDLDLPTVECLEEHIRKQYTNCTADLGACKTFFETISSGVAGLLGI